MTTLPRYSIKGTGNCVVLVHGFCENRNIWSDFSHHLADRYCVLCPDLNGFGESPLLPVTTIENLAESLKGLLDKLSIQRCVMVGHSLGGYVTLAFAEKYASMLDGIGLFHSTAFADDEEKKEVRTKTIEFVKQNGGEKFVETAFPNLFGSSYRSRFPEKVERYVKEAAQTKSEAIWETTLAMRERQDRTHLLKNLNIPVLFIVGKQDNAVPLEKSMAQIHLPKESHVLILEDVGHNGMLEAPTVTLKAVKSFLDYIYARD
ncbi:MAG: alpha/beta hydrolase [Flammeovirgaceae bacterium]|nr:alpha/beta hydrolase [Flammeovirgaceae bacterium]MDW8286676.1 alpha/beta hydrolase [Flammeovirgaceae bacterium]